MQLLISDLHLDDSRPDICSGFLRFLAEQAPQADTLFILGDFFEAWIGDDDDDGFLDTIKTALKTLSTTTTIKLMHGNRDFLLGPVFAEQTGCELIADPYVIEAGDNTIVLAHGDALCTDDVEYQAFRQQVRNPAWQAQFLAKPLAERRAIAAQLRAQSKSMSSLKAEDIMDVNGEAVATLLDQTNAQILIHGHTHRPNTHTLHEGKQRIVLGDWGKLGWCCQIDDDGRCDLRSWPL